VAVYFFTRNLDGLFVFDSHDVTSFIRFA